MMMRLRPFFFAAALLAVGASSALGQTRDDVIAAPMLRADVTVSGEIVRIGDLIDNAGPASQIAVYRAPDLGTTGTLSTAQVLATLRGHQVIGVDTRNIREISITRLSRSLDSKEIERQIARALEHRNGLGDAANLSLTFDRDVESLQLDASNNAALLPVATRFDTRNGRFDVTFSIANGPNAAAAKLRFTGVAVETVETAVLARGVERNEILKSSDVVVERRPKAEVGNDAAGRDRAVGMQARRQMRPGQALRITDLAKPDLVQRDQAVMLIYESAGLYLTIRGKAMEGGTEGDVVNVINLQSKRTVSGVVVGRGQVAVSAPSPRLPPASDPSAGPSASAKISQAEAPIAVAINQPASVSRKAE